MRTQSKVVVIGGGVAGCSVLYHLTKLGWNDVTLVEASELTSGSTWHAAGLCTQMISSWNLMKVLQYSLQLYKSLEAETGQSVDFHECGSLRIGTSQARVDEFHNRKGIAETLGIPFEVITPDRARELHPGARIELSIDVTIEMRSDESAVHLSLAPSVGGNVRATPARRPRDRHPTGRAHPRGPAGVFAAPDGRDADAT